MLDDQSLRAKIGPGAAENGRNVAKLQQTRAEFSPASPALPTRRSSRAAHASARLRAGRALRGALRRRRRRLRVTAPRGLGSVQESKKDLTNI